MRTLTTLGLIFVVASTSPVVAQRLESSLQSRKRVYIRRGALEERPVPDVITLRDGTRLEVYFLQLLGERAVFYLEEADRFWVREEIPKSEIAWLQRNQYLPEDPLGGGVITRAEKQPADKDEILAGIFTGSRGRFATWRLEFHSENDKVGEFAEDAIEHGRFTLESRYSQSVGDRSFAHEVHGRGKYNLYAPGSVSNEEWLLVLTEVVLRDRDRSPEQSYGTRVIGYEALIVEFTDRRYGGFRLHFSNVGGSVWGAITHPTFQRLGAGDPAPATFEIRPIGSAQRRTATTSTRLLRANWSEDASALPSASSSSRRPVEARDHEEPRPPRGVSKLSGRPWWSPKRWKTRGWSRPVTRWGRR